MKTLNEALSHVQKHLKAPKNQHNKFGGYKYRSCEDIQEGLKQVMPEGAFITISDEVKIIGDRFYVVATATFYFADNSVSATAYAREPEAQKGMSVPMLTGSASSYARKYALNGLFSIDDNKDADYDGGSRDKPKEAPTAGSGVNMMHVASSAASVESAVKTENYELAKKLLGADPQVRKAIWGKLSEIAKEWIKEMAVKEGKSQ